MKTISNTFLASFVVAAVATSGYSQVTPQWQEPQSVQVTKQKSDSPAATTLRQLTQQMDNTNLTVHASYQQAASEALAVKASAQAKLMELQTQQIRSLIGKAMEDLERSQQALLDLIESIITYELDLQESYTRRAY